MAKPIRYEEEYVVNARGKKLFTCRWLPSDISPKALVFLCHGYATDCSTSMQETGERLAESGYAVYGLKYEGHGKSQGLHGYISSFQDIVTDCNTFYSQVLEKEEYKRKKRFLVGESMGGAVALSLHKQQPACWDGAVLIAPMCKISQDLKPHHLLISLGNHLKYIIPKWKIVPTRDIFEVGYQDPLKRKKIKENPCIYRGRPRVRTAMELLMASIEIEKRLEDVSLAMLIIHGENDVVTDPSISRLLYESAQSKDKTLRIYPSMWHGLLSGETPHNTSIVLQDMISWLDCRCQAEH